jgi:23S rRNA (pseudouridine1915-N3)-methyltransferase
MPPIHIIAIGKMKRGRLDESWAEYEKRLTAKLVVKEIDLKESNPALLQEKESKALLDAVPAGARIIAMDGRGQSLTSLAFADKMRGWQEESRPLAFLLGGADGHTDFLRKKADLLLSFGAMTWPHRLARLMLLEQLYRAQQIMAGHPYHRE